MRHFLRAAVPVKLGVILALAVTVAVLAAPPVELPAAAGDGQAAAGAGAANAPETAGRPDEVTTGPEAQVEDVTERLSANLEKLVEHLQLVLDERADEHATEALQAVIDRLSGENIGLTRAAEAVSAQGGASHDLPAAATSHPSGEDHPTSDDHPGRP
jgi:hypothetical protein